MTGTSRTIAEMLSAFADNTSGAISEQDMRDLAVSVGDANLVKTTPTWKDLVAPLSLSKIPSTGAPTWTSFGSGGLYAYSFAYYNEAYLTYQVPHDIKPGSQAFFHVHWTTSGTSTGNVHWEIEYSFANGFNQQAFPASTTITIEEPASGIAYQHMVSGDVDGPTINEPEGLIICRVKRISPTIGSNVDTVFGLSVDLHYQSDRDGTPGREPDFYT